MTSVDERIGDALALWGSGRREGAFLLVIVAVVIRARQDFPRPLSEQDSFCRFIRAQPGPRISVEYRGKQWPIERIFYKWFRCEIVHAGGLPIDIGFMEPTEPGELSVRVGGAPEYRLLVSPGWFDQLIAWAGSDA